MALATELPLLTNPSSVMTPNEHRADIARVKDMESVTKLREMAVKDGERELERQKELEGLYERTGGDLDAMEDELWKIDPTRAMEFGRYKQEMRKSGIDEMTANFQNEQERLQLMGQIASGVTGPEQHAEAIERYRDQPGIAEALGPEYDPERMESLKQSSMTQYEQLMANQQSLNFLQSGQGDRALGSALSVAPPEDWQETLDAYRSYLPAAVMRKYEAIDPALPPAERQRIAGELSLTVQERETLAQQRRQHQRAEDEHERQMARIPGEEFDSETARIEARTRRMQAETAAAQAANPSATPDLRRGQRPDIIIEREEQRSAFDAERRAVPFVIGTRAGAPEAGITQEAHDQQLADIDARQEGYERAVAGVLGETYPAPGQEGYSGPTGGGTPQVPPPVLDALRGQFGGQLTDIPEGVHEVVNDSTNPPTSIWVHSSGTGRVYQIEKPEGR